ncbi:MAG: acyltransferase family protein [Bacteroidales bacterium]|nr:acyltransferase family protein [Bacteroidales bacterium]
MVIVTGRKLRQGNTDRKKPDEHFTYNSTNAFRGIAVVLLLLGHLSEKCIAGVTYLEDGGRWAVVIFLFVSGVSLSKTYGLIDLDKRYILNRVRRLAIPYWLTLALFLFLDYCLIGHAYSVKRIILAIGGIMYPWPPMGHAWFITYLIFLYGLYYFVSLLKISTLKKVYTLFLLSYLSMLIIINTRLFNYFALWVIYTAVFPAAVFIGMYRNKILDYLRALFGKSRVFYVVIMLALLAYYLQGSAHGWLSQPDNVLRTVHTFQPLTLVAFLSMLACIVDSFRYQSKMLLLLGEYSYEIYLLHFPFMEYYDFLLFRKPLVAYFFIYLLAIFLMSCIVRQIAKNVNQKMNIFSVHLKNT